METHHRTKASCTRANSPRIKLAKQPLQSVSAALVVSVVPELKNIPPGPEWLRVAILGEEAICSMQPIAWRTVRDTFAEVASG